MAEEKKVKAEKMELSHINRKTVLLFLDWLQDKKKSKVSTRNQRLAAIHAFCKYMQYEDVTRIEQWHDILAIKIKKAIKPTVSYLSLDGIKLLLGQIPRDSKTGRRDLTMLSLLYDSGARAQELVDLRPVDLHLTSPCYVTLFGKGRKKRLVPLQKAQVNILAAYVEENMLDKPSANYKPLFQNGRGEKLTTAGLAYILYQYVRSARIQDPDLIPERISPHCLRHSKAMHLLQSGVNLVYIRDILGHVSIQTTEIYARADSKQKREALEAAYVTVIPDSEEKTSWEKDSELKLWLKSLGK
ncbi:tyrosine recombinase XerD [Bacteroidia bacterium]|nr:tyrosine recombinase XerD [Bacteroidia bacterium]